MPVPFVDLAAQRTDLGADLERALAEVIEADAYVDGPAVARFERAYADYCEAERCCGVANGTVALFLALVAADIGPGDEVILPAMTFVATAEAVVWAGAQPVLVDVDPESGLIDLVAAEAAVGDRTAALIPVHLWGQMVDMGAARELAARHGLFLLEDAAQAQGARHGGHRAGSQGDAASFSFYPAKNLGAMGEAGAVTTGDGALAERIVSLRNHGRDGHDEHPVIGVNARLETLQAAALEVKLSRLDAWNEMRREHAAHYDDALAGEERVRSIRVAPEAEAVFYTYVVRVPDRDRIRESMSERGVQTAVHYSRAVHQYAPYSEFARTPLPAAEGLAAEVISLPMYPHLREAQLDEVVEALSRALEEGR